MGTVSVVFGGVNYSLLAPPHSYINAHDFQTPKLLAKYLFKLSQNLDLTGEESLIWNEVIVGVNFAICSTIPWRKGKAVIVKWFFDEKPCENFHWTNNTIN